MEVEEEVEEEEGEEELTASVTDTSGLSCRMSRLRIFENTALANAPKINPYTCAHEK